MDPPDDDIQFDFFDEEPVTAETQSRVRLPQRPTRRPRVPRAPSGPHPVNPLLRMSAIVAVVILVVLFFAILISSCAGESKHSKYANYLDKVSTIASQSTTDGQHTVSALTTSGVSVTLIVRKLRSIAAQEQQNVAAAQSLNPPGKLRDEQSHLIEALLLRVSGVTGLATAFENTIGSKQKESAEALALSQQAYRLVTSDVVYDDLFKAPTEDLLKSEGVKQVTVPESRYLAAPDLVVTVDAMTAILDRIKGNAGGGPTTGLHGTNLVSVQALPDGTGGASQTLSAGTLNTVTTSSSLVFQVTIHDGGDSQEVQIPVTLTIDRPRSQGGPIVKTTKIQLIDKGQDASVTFGDLGQVPFAAKTTVSVDVGKVPGETNASNNSAQYDVIFSLPS
jgi:hypothetical protein